MKGESWRNHEKLCYQIYKSGCDMPPSANSPSLESQTSLGTVYAETEIQTSLSSLS